MKHPEETNANTGRYLSLLTHLWCRQVSMFVRKPVAQAGSRVCLHTCCSGQIAVFVSGTGKVSALTCGARQAVALVLVHQVDAAAAVLAGAAVALLHLQAADGAGVARLALAGEGGDAVPAHAVVAGLRVAVVHVLLAQRPRESWEGGGDRDRGRRKGGGGGGGDTGRVSVLQSAHITSTCLGLQTNISQHG